MTNKTHTRPELRDPYLIEDNIIRFTAAKAEATAALSNALNRGLAITALVCAAYGGITGDKTMTAASAGLALTHAANARFSRRTCNDFKAIEDAAESRIMKMQLHPQWMNFKRPTSHGLNPIQLENIGRLQQRSYRERAIKYGNLVLDFTALAAASQTNGYVAGAVLLSALGVASLKVGHTRWSAASRTHEKLGQHEADYFMRKNSDVLERHVATPQ